MVTGHIRPRKTKSGKVSYQLVFESERNPINGERQRMYETVKGTKKDAEKRLNTRLYELNNGGVISKPSALKLSDWMMDGIDYILLIFHLQRGRDISNRLSFILSKSWVIYR